MRNNRQPADLNDVFVFAKVVETGSFTAAAAALRMPKSTVSRKVADLEKRLHARLLQRTTRKVTVTDVGRTYFDYCARIVGELEAAEQAVSNLEESPRGLLRVTAPVNFGFLGPIVAGYLANYRDVQIELVCTDRVVRLVDERFDVGVRAGKLSDSTLIARSLGSAPRILVASPAYLKKRGPPRVPADLANHDCLLFGAPSTEAAFELERGARRAKVAVTPRLVVNDFDLLYDAVDEGLGIALMATFECMEALRTKRLAHVLDDWKARAAPIHAVYPSTRHLSPKVTTFVDHLQQQMTPPPWESHSGIGGRSSGGSVRSK